MKYNNIPAATMETLTAWIETGRPMGSFCRAVVSNDLRRSFAQADEQNRLALFDIVVFLHWEAPPGSWGKSSVLKTWPEQLARRRASQTERMEVKEK